MNRGVEVLLKRMESTPEEFMGQQGSVTKWGWVIQSVVRRAHQGYPAHSADVPYLLDDEVKAIYDKWLELQRELFTEKVLKTLLADSEPDQRVPEQLELDLLANNKQRPTTTGIVHAHNNYRL